MGQPNRFLFDECIGKPVMLNIRRLVATAAEFLHICDHLGPGAKDSDWVPVVAAEGGWVVITSDGGKNSKKGDKLPTLCVECGVTHVILSRFLHHLTSSAKAGAIIQMWPQIELLHAEPPGTRFRLRRVDTRRGQRLTLDRQPPETPAGAPVIAEHPADPNPTDGQPSPLPFTGTATDTPASTRSRRGKMGRGSPPSPSG